MDYNSQNDKPDFSKKGENIDVSYARMFEGKDSDYISNYVCYFSNHLSKKEEDDLKEKEPEELLKLLKDRVYNHVEEWIDDLPHNDLRILRELVKKGRMEFYITNQEILLDRLCLIHQSIGPEHSEFIIHDDIKKAVAPYLDAAIEKKEKNKEEFFERLIMGVLNIVGCIEESKAREVIRNLLPQSHSEFTPEDVDRFFDHSMVVKYHRGTYLCQSDGDLWSHLVDVTKWDEEIREDEKPFYPTDFDDIIAHGGFPYLHPYRAAEQTLYSMFVDTFKYEHADALRKLTYYYSRWQEPNYTVKEMLQEISEEIPSGNLEQDGLILEVLTEFSNGIPKFILKGNTSSEV